MLCATRIYTLIWGSLRQLRRPWNSLTPAAPRHFVNRRSTVRTVFSALSSREICPEMQAVAKMADLTKFCCKFWQIWRNCELLQILVRTGESGKILPKLLTLHLSEYFAAQKGCKLLAILEKMASLAKLAILKQGVSEKIGRILKRQKVKVAYLQTTFKHQQPFSAPQRARRFWPPEVRHSVQNQLHAV